ncbi:glycosyltransferase family 2 protein [Methylomonas sp. LL1]|uniref:glycosyltransferase family 2 protein n=1 Tax=Methylomonas sp. LL1 TaxID=2785785 RepID=UPI0018C445B4|nr:glycosyltransferase family 2 protein [Methylomonas sp. LL1]QPK62112.1 glycosyltransferase family 2 protein [Methylomonas sp. LL1]CAG1020933.1 (heptosyl)LPS beta-1,4-glucosyltransferase [Methylococcales bacterium]
MPNQNPKLSVIIITLNEAENIRACLESVSWADEIIVVDAGSSDETVKICRELGAKVLINSDWQGFGFQKNLALKQATGDWVLSLDADERISPTLRQLIQNILVAPSADGYLLPRLAFFLGTAMHHGGWWPDYVLRLFRRELGEFSPVLVHETVLLQGKVEKLQEPIIHYSYVSLEQLLEKINAYSSAGASQAHGKQKRGGLAKALARGGWAFFRAYCLRAGFLDGSAGLIAAISKGEETYYRYLKLSFLAK